ncbi:hypothetical protein SLA2020_494040 [Shorea laevis]
MITGLPPTARLLLIALVLGSAGLLAASDAAPQQPPPPPPPPSNCTEELVLFSPCLPYISSPPNNLSATASDGCCDAFSSALNSSSNGVCLCYLSSSPQSSGFQSMAQECSLCLPSVHCREMAVQRRMDLWRRFAQGHQHCLLSGAQKLRAYKSFWFRYLP